METELVSVITPLYNCAGYVEKTIRSVQAQTYANWEMIIVDDCSTDGSYEAVESMAQSDPRIRLLRNHGNSGPALSRNRALREARGRWIAFLDSDDLWMPTKLERQIAFMRSNGYAFTYTRYRAIDDGGKELGIEITAPKRLTYRDMARYDWVGCLTVMYDASVTGVIQIPDLAKRNDYAIWLKVIKKTPAYLLDEPLAYYRHRAGGISRQCFVRLLKHQYYMFRKSEGLSVLAASFCTLRNLFYGFIKKQFYKSNYIPLS